MVSAYNGSRSRDHFLGIHAFPANRRSERVKIALISFHFAEYASRLALALDARHDVLLILEAANAELELSRTLRDAVDRRGNVLWFGGQRRRSAPFHAMRLWR